MAKFKGRILSSKTETPDTKTITLESADRPDFRPGQFFMLEFGRKEKIPKRSYSTSSSPTRKGILEFTVKQMPDGYVSKLLNDAPVGEELMIDGPWGHFVFDEAKMPEIAMLAAGSGIAPFRCFCQYMLDRKLSTKAILVYSNKTESDIICRKDFDEFVEKIPGLKVIYSLTREEKAGFVCGRIDMPCITDILRELPNAFFFICGPPAMVSDTEKLVSEAGVPKERIRTEKYG